MLRTLKSYFSPTHPFRLFWHRFKAFLACVLYRFPADKLIVIGITGTNGKTTTVNLTTKMLEKAGYNVGMASTVNFKVGRKEWQNISHKTTIIPFQLQKLLRQMVRAGCQYAVLETTSHSLSQHRVAGISFDVVCITNVSPEHLDYHRSLKAYREDKMKLFKGLIKGKRKEGILKQSIHNVDDPENFSEFLKFAADKKIAYGRTLTHDSRIHEQITAKEVQFFPEYTNFVLVTEKGEIPIRSRLTGEFNLENILAAAAIAKSQNVKLSAIKAACEEVRLIPGRMEKIDEGQPFSVYIDFALTENGYQKLLSTLRPLTKGKLWVVFGCCGDRDQKKRPKIGEICGTMADRVIVCDDEPYTENPDTIRFMILEGLEQSHMKKNEQYFEIPDRKQAIAFAVSNAGEGDTIVIPGMGDFEGRTFADGLHPWNERQVVRSLLLQLDNKK